ncbi:MAG: hypothetical protein KGJ86_19595 [Chloroflexota bacterium]|nr:hypothetical protein [Chloroflexota bacterium]
MVFGILVDLDHLFDYFYAERRLTFSLRTFLRSRHWRKSGRLFVFFHAFEYLPLVYCTWHALRGRRWAMAATTAMSVHLLADQTLNDLRPWGYFILYRLCHRFRASELLDFEAQARILERREAHRRMAREGRLPLRLRIVDFFV